MAVSGDITEVTYNHPTLGNGTFWPKAGEDSTFDRGGFVANDDANMIAGNGEMINQMNRKRWSFEVVCAWTSGALEAAQALANSPELADWTFTSKSGSVHSGNGTIVGDVQGNGNAGTFTLKVSGGGELNIQ